MRPSLLRVLALAGVAFLGVAGPTNPAAALEGRCRTEPGTAQRFCQLPLNKSLVIDLPRDATDILVSNPAIADAVVRTARRIYLTGISAGNTDLFVFDAQGGTIVSIDLVVEGDTQTQDVAGTLARLIPGSRIQVDIVNNNIVLSGSVRTAGDARRAIDVAEAFHGARVAGSQTTSQNQTTSQTQVAANTTAGATNTNTTTGPAPSNYVVNMLTIEGEDQVHVRVTVAEIQRTTIKNLGINLEAGGFATAVLRTGLRALADSIGIPLGDAETRAKFSLADQLNGTVQALEQANLLRTLAEPTLTAISGESASFLAGGEFPVPTGRDPDTGQVTIEYKQFGVSLSFTPVVLSEGRISLHVRTEVSELSSEGAIQISGVSVPSLAVRRGETTLELPSGGAMVMGGLLRDQSRQALGGFPGLKNLPVLGALFGSRDYQRNETELVIIVTPYLVSPTTTASLARPDDGFAAPNDSAANFLNRLNRMYGVQGQPAPAATYYGRYGFIIE